MSDNRGYLWISYGDLLALAQAIARVVRSRVPRGAHIGLCAGNCIEWAACDLACALAGCVSVGIHSTYDVPSALHAMKTGRLIYCFFYWFIDLFFGWLVGWLVG